MINNEFIPGRALKATRLIYYALIAGHLLFLLAAFMVSSGRSFFLFNVQDPLFLVTMILTFTSIPIGGYVSKTFIRLNPADPLAAKYQIFQTRLIINMATCEGPGFLAILCFLITNNTSFLIFLVIVLSAMMLNYPSLNKLSQELELSQAETDLFATGN